MSSFVEEKTVVRRVHFSARGNAVVHAQHAFIVWIAPKNQMHKRAGNMKDVLWYVRALSAAHVFPYDWSGVGLNGA